jgi:hypothetical protein
MKYQTKANDGDPDNIGSPVLPMAALLIVGRWHRPRAGNRSAECWKENILLKAARMILFAASLNIGTACLAEEMTAIPVEECHDMVGISSLMVTAEGDGIRSFYNNRVQVMLVDLIEPAASATGLVVLLPDPVSHLGERLCKLVARFYNLDVDATESSYDPKTGLQLSVPVIDLDIDGNGIPGRPLLLTVNVATGTVAAKR